MDYVLYLKILQDDDIINNMMICFQEALSKFSPINNGFANFNFNLAYLIQSVLSCIKKLKKTLKKMRSLEITTITTFFNNKIEIILPNVHAPYPIWIMNIYVDPYACVSIFIKASAKKRDKQY